LPEHARWRKLRAQSVVDTIGHLSVAAPIRRCATKTQYCKNPRKLLFALQINPSVLHSFGLFPAESSRRAWMM
jgi:hypothetical protein